MATLNGKPLRLRGRTFGEVADEVAVAYDSASCNGRRYAELSVRRDEWMQLVALADRQGLDELSAACIYLLLLEQALQRCGVSSGVKVWGGAPRRFPDLGGISFVIEQDRTIDQCLEAI